MNELKWHLRHSPRDVDGIVEEHVRRWQLQPNDDRTTCFWPAVTISRESGSLGLALGRRVAARLGFAFWDQEIVTTVAERLHIDPSKALALDEHAPDVIEVILTALRLAHSGVNSDYCAQLRILLGSIGQHGSAVVLGRGAHCIIPATHALRVRLVAPVELRIIDHARTCEKSREEAAHEVAVGDKGRAEFVWRTFHSDVTAPADYDLIINVGTYTPQRAESLVLMAYLAKFGHLPAESQTTESHRDSGVISTGNGLRARQDKRVG